MASLQMMKTLYTYIVKSFLGPLALTLVIALFILLMQFIWIWIDDLVGKGLSTYLITKFMVWVTLALIPLALPLAILLASIMTFGNLAENSELTALKSSGLSLPRIMAPLFCVIFFISILAFLFSNYTLPVVNLKRDSLLWDIRNAKPGLQIQQDIFYNGIDGYSIRVAEKDPDQETIHDVMVYDHTDKLGNIKLILAKSGKMKMSHNLEYLVFTLYDGNKYDEMVDNNQQRMSHPMMVNHFEELTVYFDLSGFSFSRTKEDLFKNNYEMMDMRQLKASSDSIKKQLTKSRQNFGNQLTTNFVNVANIPQKKYLPPATKPIPPQGVIAGKAEISNRQQGKMILIDAALNNMRNAKDFVKSSGEQLDEQTVNILNRNMAWYHNFTFPFSCLVLFFIGAPLGAIIRKGGLGLPVVVAALFFVLFYILTIMGMKFAKEEVMSVFMGSWMPAIFLLPIAVFLSYKATVDSSIFDPEAYTRFFMKLRSLIKVRGWLKRTKI